MKKFPLGLIQSTTQPQSSSVLTLQDSYVLVFHSTLLFLAFRYSYRVYIYSINGLLLVYVGLTHHGQMLLDCHSLKIKQKHAQQFNRQPNWSIGIRFLVCIWQNMVKRNAFVFIWTICLEHRTISWNLMAKNRQKKKFWYEVWISICCCRSSGKETLHCFPFSFFTGNR